MPEAFCGLETVGQTVTILACGLAGALAYTWSDTFWFSAPGQGTKFEDWLR